MEPLDDADGQYEPQNRTKQPQKGSEETQHNWVAWWNGLTTGGVIYLFALSQILVRFSLNSGEDSSFFFF